MPTGYTAAIKDGITFEQFAMSCARAMGALVMMRDEPTGAPIPEHFDPSDYSKKALVVAQANLARLQAMPVSVADSEASADHQGSLAAYLERKRERAELRGKYQSMLGQVDAWTPPTADHAEFRAFMAKQLRESIDFDCCDQYDDEPKAKTGAEWLAEQIAKAYRDIGYHSKAYSEELERTESRNNWLKALRESLPK